MKKIVVIVLFLGFMASYSSLLFAYGCGGGGGGGGYRSGMPMGGGNSKSNPVFVVYKALGTDGEFSYGYLTNDRLKALQKEKKLEATALRNAVAVVRKKWHADKSAPKFMLKKISVPQVFSLRNFYDVKKANTYIEGLKRETEKRKELEANARKRKFSRMKEDKKNKMAEQVALSDKAFAMVMNEMKTQLSMLKAKAAKRDKNRSGCTITVGS